MKLSKNAQSLTPEGAYAVLSQAQKLERSGKKIIHFEIGQPDFPTPNHITEAAIHALKSGKTKYTPPLGTYELRKVLAQNVTKKYGISVNPEQIAITPSGKTAIFIALAAILNPGDEVIYPDPGFPTYRSLTQFFGAIPKPIELLEERGFSFNLKKLEKLINSKTRVLIINSPSNPTGGVIPAHDLKVIADLVKETDLWVVSDDIYSETLYTKEPFASIYAYPKMKERTIILDSFSKTYAMTGWRLGYMVVPEKFIEKVDCLLTHTIGCTASFTQEAGIAAILGSEKPLFDMVKQFRIRRDYIVKALNEIPGITCQEPQGAFYVFPNIKSFKMSSKNLAKYLLNEAGVALLDGTAFGKFGEGYLRISYAADLKTLEKGITQIAKALKKLR